MPQHEVKASDRGCSGPHGGPICAECGHNELCHLGDDYEAVTGCRGPSLLDPATGKDYRPACSCAGFILHKNPSDRLGGLYEETGLFEGPSTSWPAYLAALRATMVAEIPGADQIAELWRTFGGAITEERLRRAYGDYWPRRPVPGERLWVFYATPKPVVGDFHGSPHGELAAWGALRPDPVEPFAWLMLGVWPRHQGKGWAEFVRRWLVMEVGSAFSDAQYVMLEVLKGNGEHLERWLTRTPNGWRRVGEVDLPSPGAVIFAFDKEARSA